MGVSSDFLNARDDHRRADKSTILTYRLEAEESRDFRPGFRELKGQSPDGNPSGTARKD